MLMGIFFVPHSLLTNDDEDDEDDDEVLLSPKERRFVSSPNSFSSEYGKAIRSRIKKKIDGMASDIALCLQNQNKIGIDVYEITKTLLQEINQDKKILDNNEDDNDNDDNNDDNNDDDDEPDW